MAHEVIEVFTNKSKEFMFELGGSASWLISEGSRQTLKFCICVRNDDASRAEDHGARPEARNEAFLVGRIASIEFMESRNDRDRYIIRFKEYAEVSLSDFRVPKSRNPVAYRTKAECAAAGLDLDKLDFKPMPKHEPTQAEPAKERKGLSMAEAKDGLSIYFNVPVEAIQITITG